MHRFVSLFLAIALLSGSGCVRRYTIPTAELRKLDGFEARPLSPGRSAVQPYRLLQSDDGATVTFEASTELLLRGATGLSGGRFRQIRVTPAFFDGVLADPAQPPLHLDFTSIQGAEATVVDPARTALLLLGGGGLVVSVFLFVGLLGVLNLG